MTRRAGEQRWELVSSWSGAEAREHALRPQIAGSRSAFSTATAATCERLEVWRLPTTNPGLAAEVWQAQAFDAHGDRIGRIEYREDYDVDQVIEGLEPRREFEVDAQGHAGRRRGTY